MPRGRKLASLTLIDEQQNQLQGSLLRKACSAEFLRVSSNTCG